MTSSLETTSLHPASECDLPIVEPRLAVVLVPIFHKRWILSLLLFTHELYQFPYLFAFLLSLSIASGLLMQNIINDLLDTGLHVSEIVVKYSLVNNSLGEDRLIEARHGTNILTYVLHREWCRNITALFAKNWTEHFGEMLVNITVVPLSPVSFGNKVRLLTKNAFSLLIRKCSNHTWWPNQTIVAKRKVIRLHHHAPTFMWFWWKENIRNILRFIILVS